MHALGVAPILGRGLIRKELMLAGLTALVGGEVVEGLALGWMV